MNYRSETTTLLRDLRERMLTLENKFEMMNTVLIVKEPDTVRAADAYDGLRKQVIATTTARRTHVGQLVTMAVALERAADLGDLRPQVAAWLQQAGVVPVWDVPARQPVEDFFENLDGGSWQGVTTIEIVEPAYVDEQLGTLVRLGRARPATPRPAPALVATSQSEQPREQAEADSGPATEAVGPSQATRAPASEERP